MVEWTDKEIMDLLFWKEKSDLSYAQIAEKLGRSVSACRNKYTEVMREHEREEDKLVKAESA